MEFMAFMEQMGGSNIPLVAAFFIGLMTAISPCPLATNITAIAYVSRELDDNKHTILVGILYTFGRMFTYAGLASLIVYIGLNTQQIAPFLQSYGEKLIGPILILIGLVMLEIVKLNFIKGGTTLERLKDKLANEGYLGAFLLGVLFALAFCPFSAVLYFGMMIPLALRTHDGILIPSVFAIATGLPVILSSILLVKGMKTLGTTINKIQTIERIMRKAMAIVFLITGVYYLQFLI